MCKDPQTGDYLRADHLVENVLEARLEGDRDARGQEIKKESTDVDAKKAKRKVKDVKAIKLDDAVVIEYEEILAQVHNLSGIMETFRNTDTVDGYRLTTLMG